MSTMYNLLHIPLCTVMLILIFNSTAYCHAHSFIFYILFFISYFSFILSYVYFPCVVFSIFALSMERTRLSFHCWLYSLCIVVYVTNKTWNLKLPGAERVRLHVSAFNSAPDCKRLLSAIGLFGTTWSRTHLVYRWNITTIQTVWGEPKLNHSLYRQLQPGRCWKWVCEFVYRMLLSLLQIPI